MHFPTSLLMYVNRIVCENNFFLVNKLSGIFSSKLVVMSSVLDKILPFGNVNAFPFLSFARIFALSLDNPIIELSASLYFAYIQRVMQKLGDMADFFTYSVIIYV